MIVKLILYELKFQVWEFFIAHAYKYIPTSICTCYYVIYSL